ncbi:CoA transferase [Hyphobacterium sp. SN044]|uniref:CaiB/BaiF CoA transferase family protein n=1 Tax=Hyphobacterium sp. SN044 TaxID=2912575 RepID=UPI001F2D9E2F|nr:CaiB/BaiF CoA-transferase family protein [Hyphobacterium sp. SN044]MCF8879527.1 CoA transferase [Hyphobacterium sp. SN044]
MTGPLHGIRIIELSGIGPGPLAGQLLADLGAEVIAVDRTPEPRMPERPKDTNRRGKKSIALNLKHPDAVETVLKLCESADALIEGYRPGVTERLGIGPDAALKRNPKLVYGRLTGWGQTGPLADRAGHDINYIAISGALGTIGTAERPLPPLNLVGDYAGGSLMLCLGVLAAILNARTTGKGQVVDAAMTDGSAAIMSLIHSLLASGIWTDRRGDNLLDGATPFYRCYETSDGGFMAVGAIEPQFYAQLLAGLNMPAEDAAKQWDKSDWPRLEAEFTQRFASKTRAEWTTVFEGTDACVSPVLSLTEAPDHPHNAARGTFLTADGLTQPAPAPRFAGTPAKTGRGPFFAGEDTREILMGLGVEPGEIDRMVSEGIAGESA